MQGHPAVVAGGLPDARPHVLARGQQLVEQGGGVVPHAGGQHEGLPRARGQGRAGQLVQDGGHPVHALERGRRPPGPVAPRPRPQVLPVGEEPGVGGLVHRLDLGAQRGEGAHADPPQHLGVAPLGVQAGGPGGALRPERARAHAALGGQALQHREHDGAPQPQRGPRLGGGEGAVGAGVAAHEVPERVVDRVEECGGHSVRDRRAERVPQAGGVLDGGEPLDPVLAQAERAAGALELRQHPGDGVLVRGLLRLPLGPCAPRGLRHGQRSQQAQQVRHALGPAGAPVGREPLQLGLDLRDDLGVEQLAQLLRAQQLGQQRRVEGERGGAALGQRGVALVDELGDVAEQDGLAERRGRRRRDLHEPDGPRGHPPRELLERREVVDVLEHLAHGLQDHGEPRVLPRHVQQLRGPLPLLPQGGPPPGVTARQQQGPGRVLPEPGGEQRGPADLRRDDLVQLLGRELEQLRARRLRVHQGDAQHDPVVGRHRRARAGLQPVPLRQPRPHRERPRGVHRHAVGGVQHHAPVAELVREPLHHERLLGGQHPGGLALVLQVGQQVVLRPRVQARGGQAGAAGLGVRVQLAAEAPDGVAQLRRPARGVAPPERELAGLPVGGQHQDAVRGDVHDAPARGAQQDDVPHAGLVDHLLVELADPAPAGAGRARGRGARRLGRVPGRRAAGGAVRAAVGGQEHPEQAAVRDGAARGDREALGAGAGGERAVLPVPQDARAQLGELVRGVAAGQQVEHGLVGGERQRGERRGPAHEVEPLLRVQVRDGDGGHGLLGEDVQRVGGDPQRLDAPGRHALGHDGGVHEVAPVLGEEHAAGDLTHLVAGAAHALQTGGHRGRRLHLDHLVHRAHVDAQLERARGHDAADLAGLQRLLDDGALLLGHGAVVGAGEVGDGARSGAGLPGHLGGAVEAGRVRCAEAGDGVRVLGRGGRLGAGLPDLVEPTGEALGQAAGVGEHERGAPLGHQVHDPLLDVRPDGPARHRALVAEPARRGAGPQVVGCGGGGEVRQVRHRHRDRQVPALGRGGPHHRHRLRAAEEPGHLGGRLDRGGQADPLHRRVQQGVQALEGDGQVGAALGPGHGVHLVHDHRADPGQRRAGLRGEHEVQRLGRGDEDVRRILLQAPSLGRRGVPGAHTHPHARHGPALVRGGLRDAHQRGPQVPLHVHAERLQRRDVEDAGGRRPLGGGLAHERVERPEEGGEGLARAGRRDHQRVPPRGDRVPRAELGRRRGLERAREPGARGLGEPAQDDVGRGRGRARCGLRGPAHAWWYGRPAEISWAR